MFDTVNRFLTSVISLSGKKGGGQSNHEHIMADEYVSVRSSK